MGKKEISGAAFAFSHLETAWKVTPNLFASSSCNSVWFIPPLQDFLFMEKKYWHEKCEEERINVPGTVNEFNWTYRMPISIDELLKDTKLIEKITAISKNRGGN